MVFLLLTVFFTIFYYQIGVESIHATEKAGASFVISGNMPANQQSESGYFDLLVEPGDLQTLEVNITNVTNQEIEVVVTLADATTTNNGSVNYQVDDTLERDSSLKLSFLDMASLDNEQYRIAANSTVSVPIHLTIPDRSFSGIVLGGITATEQLTDEATHDSSNNTTTGIQNIYSYSIAALLRENEDSVETNMVLNEVFAAQRNYRNYIHTNLQNRSPRIINELSVEAKVYNEKNDLAYQSESAGLKMAPNSNFDYGINLQETKFIPGDYLLSMKVIADGIEFHFTEEFTIETNEAKKYNESAVLIETQETSPYLYIIIAILLGIMGTLFIVYVKKQKVKKNEKQNQ